MPSAFYYKYYCITIITRWLENRKDVFLVSIYFYPFTELFLDLSFLFVIAWNTKYIQQTELISTATSLSSCTKFIFLVKKTFTHSILNNLLTSIALKNLSFHPLLTSVSYQTKTANIIVMTVRQFLYEYNQFINV